MSEWRDYVEENAAPVADVKELVETLEEWCLWTAVSEQTADALYMRTRKLLNDITGTETGSAPMRELQLAEDQRKEGVPESQPDSAQTQVSDVS